MQRTWRNSLPITFFVVLFVFSGYLGWQTAYEPVTAQVMFNGILLAGGAYLLIAYLPAAPLVTRGAAVLLTLGLTVFTLLFIGHYASLSDLYPDDYGETPQVIDDIGRVTSLLPAADLGRLHPNTASTIIEVVLPLAVALLLARRGLPLRLLGAVMTFILLYALFLTYSRGSWIGVAGALVIFIGAEALRRLPRALATTVIAGLGTVIVLGVVGFLVLGPGRLPGFDFWASTADSRLTLYRNSLYMAYDYPFTGIGLGSETFAWNYATFALLIQDRLLWYAHNLFLSVWVAQGLLGLIALTGLLISFYAFVVHVIRRGQPDALFHGAWVGVTAGLLHGFTDARQYIEPTWLMPLMLAGFALTVALGHTVLREAPAVEPAPTRSPLRVLIPVGAAVVLVIAGLVLSRDLLLAGWYTNQGALAETRAVLLPDLTGAEREAAYQQAADWYAQALAVNPAYAPAARRAGNLDVRRERFVGAVPLLETALQDESTNPAAIKGLGLAYMWVGRVEDAVRVLATLPPSANIRQELGNWASWRGSAEQNQPLLAAYAWETEQALNGDEPDHAGVWAIVGDYYRQAGQPEDARRAYERSLAVDPNNAQAQEGLAALR